MDARRFILRVVAGGYVFYIGIQMLMGMLNGTNEMNPVISIAAIVLFLGFGGWSVLSALIPVIKNGGFMPSGTAADESDEDLDDSGEDADETESDAAEATEASDTDADEE